MKVRRFTLAVFAAAAAGATLLNAFGQGSLTPPAGPAGPTMRTLTQVEPRIPLTAGSPGVTVNPNGGFSITGGGSYYLTANLAVTTGSGIQIKASGVSLDLMGFTISSPASPAAGDGVSVDVNISSVSIRNGHIRGTSVFDSNTGTASNNGFLQGIAAVPSASPVTVSDVNVSGISGNGIHQCHSVERCGVSHCDTGISGCGMISGCTVDRCKRGISGGTAPMISHCRVDLNGLGVTGIAAFECTISDTSVKVVGAGCTGIDGGTASFGSSITGCQVSAYSPTNSGTATGILNPGGQVTGCRVLAYVFGGGTSLGIDASEGGVSHCHVQFQGTAAGHTAIKAKIADACVIGGGTSVITNRYNMPATP